VYGPGQVFKDYDYLYRRDALERHRVVHGHFWAAKLHGLFPAAKRITWLRHPVSWVISLYHYSKGCVPDERDHLLCRLQEDNLSLLEFAQHPLARNQVSRYFLYGADLDDFFFVGLTEHFRDDLRVLARMLGWPEVEPRSYNINPEPGYAEAVRGYLSDRQLVARIESYFDRDMALYEQALAMRARRNRRVDPASPAPPAPLGRDAVAPRLREDLKSRPSGHDSHHQAEHG
jgi:hypothetical protein